MSVLFSRACEYALRGLAEMARHNEKESWTIQELADQTDTPAPFLAKSFQILVRNGILKSVKGRGGGFSFAQPVDKIHLIKIVETIDGFSLAEECVLGLPECGGENPCPFHDQWAEIRESIIRALSTQTLAQFARNSEH
ncbi:Rrf2 family transcriptional regulator [candidate division KSB1 bacterium]|nr:Rrf2 family transcriptional regulator [candidate division KSB1 bacterium]NIR73470.1 Rrf2 family transcriptional regulator [candidate division KSB1 bacterium]NIS25274.1 Rrf2 family transcriptional regulator [candidate division KSB1 bacterium]NIT72178.1 Rrf2 family transcriptional regulator [candidate division KSB1 bacterium]NIU25996.1 Rrf2 family transcriptional regulator [candidate division KSB1 bacterium]